MKVELIRGPLDGAVIEVPPQTTLISVDRRKSLHATCQKSTPTSMWMMGHYSIVFDDRRPLRALYIEKYPGNSKEQL